jgi:hypothetical protein
MESYYEDDSPLAALLEGRSRKTRLPHKPPDKATNVLLQVMAPPTTLSTT